MQYQARMIRSDDGFSGNHGAAGVHVRYGACLVHPYRNSSAAPEVEHFPPGASLAALLSHRPQTHVDPACHNISTALSATPFAILIIPCQLVGRTVRLMRSSDN